MKETFFTIKEKSKGLFKDKGSKFLAFAFPVQSVHQVKQHLQELKSKYHDARHHCYAYIIGSESEEFRSNDDGEPNHSAGDSILGAIRSKNLTNVLVIVVRYFGGTKLGIRGLINAYRFSSDAALDSALIIEVEIRDEITITFPYSGTSEVMHQLNKVEVIIYEQEFKEICIIRFGVKLKRKEGLTDKLRRLQEKGIIQSIKISPD
jgi:uncharacterized YigZ family protein